jgi:hypothetical protein
MKLASCRGNKTVAQALQSLIEEQRYKCKSAGMQHLLEPDDRECQRECKRPRARLAEADA